MIEIQIQTYASPVGPMVLGQGGDALCFADWGADRPRASVAARLNRYLRGIVYNNVSTSLLRQAAAWLDAYFGGEALPEMPPIAAFGTPLQLKTWQALAQIPRGATITYTQLAAEAGYPRAVRAVASAVGQNAHSILVPCHRVVPASGGVGNYAGGAAAKAVLLDIEKKETATV